MLAATFERIHIFCSSSGLPPDPVAMGSFGNLSMVAGSEVKYPTLTFPKFSTLTP